MTHLTSLLKDGSSFRVAKNYPLHTHIRYHLWTDIRRLRLTWSHSLEPTGSRQPSTVFVYTSLTSWHTGKHFSSPRYHLKNGTLILMSWVREIPLHSKHHVSLPDSIHHACVNIHTTLISLRSQVFPIAHVLIVWRKAIIMPNGKAWEPQPALIVYWNAVIYTYKFSCTRLAQVYIPNFSSKGSLLSLVAVLCSNTDSGW